MNESLLLLLLLLVEPVICPIFYLVHLFCFNVNNILEAQVLLIIGDFCQIIMYSI